MRSREQEGKALRPISHGIWGRGRYRKHPYAGRGGYGEPPASNVQKNGAKTMAPHPGPQRHTPGDGKWGFHSITQGRAHEQPGSDYHRAWDLEDFSPP